MQINTNSLSTNAQENLRQSQAGLETNMARLSSGQRINSAADDAAGLAISERMAARISGMEQGSRNSSDGMSMVQTAEGALGSVSNILQRARELAVQSSNGTNTDGDRDSLQGEFSELMAEIDHIAENTNFNGIDLLQGDDPDGDGDGGVDIQLSDVEGDTLNIALADATTEGLGLDDTAIDSDNVENAISDIDAAIDVVSDQRAEYGASLNRLNFNIDNINNMRNNLDEARGRIEDADMAAEVSEMTKNQILTQAGTSMLSQANQNPQQVTQLLG